ncbi:phage tail assembly protein [Marinifilum sp. JC120]|nr:phage tail assembly protein [Marinifilum sp. JC120]
MAVVTQEIIHLEEAIEVNKVKYASLTMRRPKVKDQRSAKKMAKTDEDYEAILFANLCEVDVAVIDELYTTDLHKLQTFYRGCNSPNMKGLGRAILALAAFSGSGFNEILEMETDDFVEYLNEMKELKKNAQ